MLDRAVEAAARALAAALKASPALATLEQAQADLEADPQAKGLMAELQQRLPELLEKQQLGTVTQEEIDGYRHLQRDAQNNPVIQAYLLAQRQAQAFLPEVNAEISQVLGFDFSRLATAVGC